MWGLSIPFWESVFRWATISAFVFGGFTATAAFVSAWVGYELSDIVQKDADRRIEEAKVEAARANESSEKLKNETARLFIEAETSRKETAQAKLELQQMRFPRRLDSDKLKVEIEGVPPQVFEVLYDQSAADSSGLAFEIFVALASVGWKTDQKLPAPLTPQQGPSDLRDVYQLLPLTQQAGGSAWGVSVVTKGPISEDPKTPERILGAALLTSVSSPVKTVGGGKDETMPVGKIRIIVGPKLP
jgi:hypothetical protein